MDRRARLLRTATPLMTIRATSQPGLRTHGRPAPTTPTDYMENMAMVLGGRTDMEATSRCKEEVGESWKSWPAAITPEADFDRVQVEEC